MPEDSVKPEKIHDIIYRIAGPDMTDRRDCAVYLIDFGEPVLIDCGSGFAFHNIINNIKYAGFDAETIHDIILTHCHFDHIGAAHLFRSRFDSRLIMHELDAEIVERGDQTLTAAFCFETKFSPLPIDKKLRGSGEPLVFGEQTLISIHTPGHTPGSISLYIDIKGLRVVFVQDIAAPLLKEFYCDPEAWMESMEKLLALDADLLCDGHSGAYGPKRNVKRYLQSCIHSQKKQGYLIPDHAQT